TEPPSDCRDWRTARTVDKDHGRLEIRELVTTTELNDFLAGQWAGVAQVFRLTRTVSEKGQMPKAGRLWHHQPLADPSQSRPTPGSDSCALDERKSAALEARCDPAGRSLPSAQGRRASRAGHPEQFSAGLA